MGVWIETLDLRFSNLPLESHPVWVCGLKLLRYRQRDHGSEVTPCMGVWIETSEPFYVQYGMAGHTLYGCVD